MNTSIKATALAAALLAAVVVAPRAEAATNGQVTSTTLSGKVTRVVVTDDVGDVTVKTGAKHSVTTFASWNTKKPKITVSSAKASSRCTRRAPALGR